MWTLCYLLYYQISGSFPSDSYFTIYQKRVMEDVFAKIKIYDIDRKHYRHEINRLESYTTWPNKSLMFPTFLARVGFYYTGQEDEVRCFHCDVRIKGWGASDLPLSLHEELSPRCNFILGNDDGNIPFLALDQAFSQGNIRGCEKALKVVRERQVGDLKCIYNAHVGNEEFHGRDAMIRTKEHMGITDVIAENESLHDRIKCKICWVKNVAILFLPCCHLTCCVDCALPLQKCPVCRAQIKATVRVFCSTDN